MKHTPAYIFLVSVSFTMSASAKFIENTDITSYVNTLIEQNKVVTIPNGNYKVSATKSIQLKNNTTLKLSPNTVLTVIPNSSDSYRVFRIKNIKNVTLSGGKIVGDKYTHLGKKGEWGMGVEIRDSQNINISNMSIDRMWGDAIYIGTTGKNTTYNINLNNITMNDNRRQGITINSIDTLNANNLSISNTGGTDPANGIDIEPNNNSTILKNININRLRTFNNKGVGFQVSLTKYNGSSEPISISLNDHIDNGSNFGFVINGAISPISGRIDLSRLNYKNNKFANFCFNQWNNNIEVNIDSLSHDKRVKITKTSWCQEYISNRFIKLQKVLINP